MFVIQIKKYNKITLTQTESHVIHSLFEVLPYHPISGQDGLH
jgi:hypothetical protein